MSSQKSLVAFTLLVQSAIGSVWCIGAALVLGESMLPYEWHSVVALVVLIAGAGFSLGHLGNPAICFYAVRNFRHSWLSREITATVTMTAAAGAMVVAGLIPAVSCGWIVLASCTVGGFALYSMARAYQLRTVPPWNRADTLLGFLGSALLLGGLLFTLASEVLAEAIPAHASDRTWLYFSRHVGLVGAFIGLVAKVGIRNTNRTQFVESCVFGSLDRPVLQSGAIALWVGSTLFNNGGAPEWVLLLSAAVALVAGEIIHRKRFYGSYTSAGLT